LLTQGQAASHPNARAGREGKGVEGKGIPAPPSLFRRRNFSCQRSWRAAKGCCPCPARPYAGNNKELP